MKKNILYISDTGQIKGGGEISFLNLLENLDKEAFNAVVCLPAEGDLSRRAKALGFAVREFSYKKVMNPLNLANTVAAIRALCALIRKENIDLVHTNSTGGIVLLSGIACRLTGRPLVSHIRLIYSGFFQDIVQGLFSRRIIIISRRIGRKFSFLFFKKKLLLVYNGVNLDNFASGEGASGFKKELGIPESAALVGAVGTYIRGKGFEYFIKAVSLLKSQGLDLYAVVVGFQPVEQGKYIKELKNMSVRAGLADRLKFLGERNDLPGVFQALDVFVFPSLIDPFGRVIIEAMACSKPVVAFNLGGAPEIIAEGETGFLVKPRDYQELAEKIAFFLKDREKAVVFGKNAHQRCLQLFDIKEHAFNVQKLYREILKDEPPGLMRCPICGNSDYLKVCTCLISEQDAAIREDRLTLRRCKICGLVSVNPQPKAMKENISQLYQEDYFQKNYMRFYGSGLDGAEQSNEPFSFRLDLIVKFKSSGNLLDVGSATGEFLKAAQSRGFRSVGIDISDYACRLARDKYGLDVRKTSFEKTDFPANSFDLITAGDILEHAQDPLIFLKEANRILKADGIIYIAVPDYGSFHYQLMSFFARFNHKNYFVLPHHVYHFSFRTLEKLLIKSGFVVLERVSSESKIQESGLRLRIMQLIFFLGRLLGAKDRLIVIAAKSRRQQSNI